MSVGTIALTPTRAVSPKQIGIAGVVIGAIAWVITIPPIEVRGMAPSIVLAVIAICAGAWSFAGGERKLGAEAIFVALLAVAGAAASAPIALTSGLVGGVLGLVVGLPFVPVGVVAGPMLGATMGAAVIAAPAAAIGAAVGAAVGAVNAFNAPPRVVGD